MTCALRDRCKSVFVRFAPDQGGGDCAPPPLDPPTHPGSRGFGPSLAQNCVSPLRGPSTAHPVLATDSRTSLCATGAARRQFLRGLTAAYGAPLAHIPVRRSNSNSNSNGDSQSHDEALPLAPLRAAPARTLLPGNFLLTLRYIAQRSAIAPAFSAGGADSAGIACRPGDSAGQTIVVLPVCAVLRARAAACTAILG